MSSHLRLQRGFTLIEMLIGVAIMAILLAIAIPSFSSYMQAGRADAAVSGFTRAVASARTLAVQTGQRTTLKINKAVSGCGSGAAPWVVQQGNAIQTCVSAADYQSRYQGAVMSGVNAGFELDFLPNGVASNSSEQTITFTSGQKTVRVRINVGGSADVL